MSAIPYKKQFDKKKLEKKDIERQVTFGANVEKKKEQIYVFSGKSIEELIVCAERAKKVFGILCLPVGRWREEFANTLDTMLCIKIRAIRKWWRRQQGRFREHASRFRRDYKIIHPSVQSQSKIKEDPTKEKHSGMVNIDMDDHAMMRIQSIVESSLYE